MKYIIFAQYFKIEAFLDIYIFLSNTIIIFLRECQKSLQMYHNLKY